MNSEYQMLQESRKAADLGYFVYLCVGSGDGTEEAGGYSPSTLPILADQLALKSRGPILCVTSSEKSLRLC